jgi:hypothetical protein
MKTLAPESISPLSVDERNEIALLPESWRIRYRCPGLTIVSEMSCPDENLTALRVNASVVDIKKNRTEPVTNAISHPYGTDTGRTGGCAPSANKSVPTVTKRAQVTDRMAKEFLTCNGFALLLAERNSPVG